MKETILSNCEKSFIATAISQGKRLDGRTLNEFRKLRITFGSDWGSCLVTLGDTKVLAQVSCEVQQPKPTRPNEGLLLVYVELSPMGAPHFEVGRQSDLAVQLNRLLEKCIKDSRCLDLESLCITAEEKVWAIRVDVNILNHEGNLIDAASIAALTALAHFRRPDVTTTGEQTIIHDPAERDPIPITLHHHPVCVSYAIFSQRNSSEPKQDEQNTDVVAEDETSQTQQQWVLADPTAIEERVSEGQLVFGMNAYRELCGLHLRGNGHVTTQLVLQCASRAAKRALNVVSQLKKALEEDIEARNTGKSVGFGEYIQCGDLLSLRQENLCVQLNSTQLRETSKNVVKTKIEDIADNSVVMEIGEGSAELITEDQKISKSIKKLEDTPADESSSEECSSSSSSGENSSDNTSDVEEKNTKHYSSDSDIEVIAEISHNEKKKGAEPESIELSGDSEEEETPILLGEDVYVGSKHNSSEGNIKTETSPRPRNKPKENQPGVSKDIPRNSDDKAETSKRKRKNRLWYNKKSW